MKPKPNQPENTQTQTIDLYSDRIHYRALNEDDYPVQIGFCEPQDFLATAQAIFDGNSADLKDNFIALPDCANVIEAHNTKMHIEIRKRVML